MAVAGAVGLPHLMASSAPGNRITLGLIGCGNINTRHREAFFNEKDARIVAVCDPITARLNSYQARINQAYGDRGCAAFRDFRDLLARRDIDAVCIGTPDHWHAAMAVAAMHAGKDVYVEKPLTYSVAEGRRVIKVAAGYGRVLQTGLQRRSTPSFRYACELVRNGRIGRLTRAEVGIIGLHPEAQTGRSFPTTAVPEDIDYDLWLGPAPVVPFCPERLLKHNWYHISDYSRGFIPGNGVHFVDIAQWGIGDEIEPVEVSVQQAIFPAPGLIDDVIAWRAEVLYENGVRMSYSSEGNPHPDGIRFIGTEDWIHIDGGGRLTASRPDAFNTVIGSDETHLYAASGPHRNFLDCIRTRRRAAASAEIGHHATTTCNLVDIAARLGRKLHWDAQSEQCVGDESANRLLSRTMRAPWQV